jgi:hypothetical protein
MIVPSPNPPLQPPAVFRAHVGRTLASANVLEAVRAVDLADRKALSVVLLLIGVDSPSPNETPEPCLILNKRSQRVRQPGDICCPGGGVEPRIDAFMAHLLRLPGSPLKNWAHYTRWRHAHPRELRRLNLLLATALREGLEEMRLNPLTVGFLGSLPSEHLVMFRRIIHPLVVWVNRQRQFYPNWEVERVIRIPLRRLLNPAHYICYRLSMPWRHAPAAEGGRLDFPAFRFPTAQGTEILWGATYRIVMGFLKKVMGFRAPDLETLDVVERELPRQYLTGG